MQLLTGIVRRVFPPPCGEGGPKGREGFVVCPECCRDIGKDPSANFAIRRVPAAFGSVPSLLCLSSLHLSDDLPPANGFEAPQGGGGSIAPAARQSPHSLPLAGEMSAKPTEGALNPGQHKTPGGILSAGFRAWNFP